MRILIVCFLIQILSGCAGARWHQETGFIDTSLTPGTFGEERLEAVQTGVKLEAEVFSLDNLSLDLGIGPSVIQPLEGSDKGIGVFLDTSARLRYTRWSVEPYIMWNIGAGDFENWKPQGTNWGFVLQAAAGIRIPWKDAEDNEDWITIDYRWWHESNGTKVFGHGKGPNPAFEGGALFIGYAFTGF